MSVEMELKLNNKKELAFSLAKELKRFPKVSELWAIAILQ